MIPGLDTFRTHFRGYESNYVLIGGVAAVQWLEDAGLVARATKDFDLVLMIEKVDKPFLQRFWSFVKAGEYHHRNTHTGVRNYYRFTGPNAGYPSMLEIFSRAPDDFKLWDDPTIIPIPANEEVTSLSAILMDDDYYDIVRENRRIRGELSLLSPAGLILLKARAYLDLSRRKTQGERIDSRDIKKHRNDVFKLSLLLAPNERTQIPAPVLADLKDFLDAFPAHAPDWESIRQANGLPSSQFDPAPLLSTLSNTFVIR